jgi:hypothetical protein
MNCHRFDRPGLKKISFILITLLFLVSIAATVVHAQDAQVDSIYPGNLNSGTIASAGEQHLYSMDANAGETFYFKLTRLTGDLSPKITIHAPSGAIVATGSDAVNLKMIVEMPATGTYDLTVEDSSGKNTGDYALTMQRVQYPVNVNIIDIGAGVSGSITAPGQVDTYTFQGTAGDVDSVSMVRDSGTIQPEVTVITPSGGILQSDHATSAYNATLKLNESGIYVILADDGQNGQGTGDYRIIINAISGSGVSTVTSVVTDVPAAVPTDGQSVPVASTSDQGGNGLASMLPLIGGVIVIVLIIIVVLAVLLMRKKKPAAMENKVEPEKMHDSVLTKEAPAIPVASPPAGPRKGVNHDTFISYSSIDKPVADAVCALLESRKIRCWIAPRDILPGTTYANAILNGINGSLVFVLVFSKDANTSPHVMREVESAVNAGIPIVTFKIDEAMPTSDMKYYIGSIHWLDAMTKPMETHLNKLADTVELLIKQNKPLEKAAPVLDSGMDKNQR